MKKKAILINYSGRRGSGTWDAYGMSKALLDKGMCCVGVFSEAVENKRKIEELPFDKILFIPTYSNKKEFIIESIRFSKKHKQKIIKEFKEYDIEYIYCPMDTQWEKKISDCFPNAKVFLVSHEPILKKGDSRITYNIFKKHMKSADIMLVHSNKFIDITKRISGKPTYYIPLGKLNFYSDCKEKKQLIRYDDTKINFLFFGRIAPNKGLDILAKAYKKVYNMLGNKVTLTIIGNGDFSPYKVDYNDLNNVTVINKWVEDEEVESVFLGNNLIVVCPYKEGSQSGVIQVAYDYGVPVVVTDVGGFSEQVQDGITGIVTSVDVDDIANAMIKMAEDKELYDIISHNEKELAKKITWDYSAEILLKIMEEYQ